MNVYGGSGCINPQEDGSVVYNLLLAFASVFILRSKSHRTHDHILLRFETPSNLEANPCIYEYIPQEHGGPVKAPGTGFPFRRLLLLAGYGGGMNWQSYLYSLGTDGTGNVSSIIACSVVGRETTSPQSCSLATAVVLSLIYTAVTWQWVYVTIS
jgi:hypothetical protein